MPFGRMKTTGAPTTVSRLQWSDFSSRIVAWIHNVISAPVGNARNDSGDVQIMAILWTIHKSQVLSKDDEHIYTNI